MQFSCTINGDSAYSDKLTEIYSSGLSRLADRVVSGEITVDDWHQQMKDAIDRMYVFQGAAGVDNDKSRFDNETVRRSIEEQYTFLDGFADAIEQAFANGTSLGFVANRATMYAKSSQAEYWRQAIGVDVPHVPKDGSTPCLSNCSCKIRVECERDANGRVIAALVFWETDPTKEEVHCDVCPERGLIWNPLRVPVRQVA